jgi:hypothetical protein
MNARMTARVLKGVVVGLAVAALAVPAAATPPEGKGPPDGKGPGGGEVDTTTHSLSVPAVFVGDNPYNLTCDGSSTPPDGEPVTGLEGEDFTVETEGTGYFYVQGVNEWQASCLDGDPVTEPVSVTAEWGDNLGGDAKLKIGSPIRVEVGLFDVATHDTFTGYSVIKLQPEELDRESAYGTEAVGDLDSGFDPVPVMPFTSADELGEPRPETRVWDADASMVIHRLNPVTLEIIGDPIVTEDPAGAEINATGRVVYGYNLRVDAGGDYRITYTFPNLAIDASDSGGSVSDDLHSVSLDIRVATGGGGGGGKNR